MEVGEGRGRGDRGWSTVGASVSLSVNGCMESEVYVRGGSRRGSVFVSKCGMTGWGRGFGGEGAEGRERRGGMGEGRGVMGEGRGGEGWEGWGRRRGEGRDGGGGEGRGGVGQREGEGRDGGGGRCWREG